MNHKKLIKAVIALLTIVSLTFSFFGAAENVKAKTAESKNEAYCDFEKCQQLIKEIESSLNEKNTTIENETILYIEMLSKMKTERDSDAETVTNINDLIDGAETLLSLYRNSKDDIGNIRLGDLNSWHALAVLAIIAWFNNQGYYLAAELLNHAFCNTVINSIYYPSYGSIVESSSVFWQCRNNYNVSYSTGEFPNSGSTQERDLYYAIHLFSWYRLSNSYIRIVDRYDFAYDKNYWGTIQGYAVAVMYSAQQLGVINPFYVYIEHN